MVCLRAEHAARGLRRFIGVDTCIVPLLSSIVPLRMVRLRAEHAARGFRQFFREASSSRECTILHVEMGLGTVPRRPHERCISQPNGAKGSQAFGCPVARVTNPLVWERSGSKHKELWVPSRST